MGAFLWMDDGLAEKPEGKEACAVFLAQSGPCRELPAGAGRLWLAAASAVPDMPFAENDHEFTAFTGTPFARGSGTVDSLAKRLSSGACSYEQLQGGFVLLQGSADKLQIRGDRLGQQHIFGSANDQVFSTSFLATATAAGNQPVNLQALREYVFFGATYGGETLSAGVSLLPAGATIVLDSNGANIKTCAPVPSIPFKGDFTDAVTETADALRDVFAAIVDTYPSIDTALSAGFDTRLMLALLRTVGAKDFALHVYGAKTSADVQIASMIAAGEGLKLACKDKAAVPALDAGGWMAQIEKNYLAFDGLPPDGIIDSGSDLASRQTRAAAGRLALNGGGGEILRNFFYLPDRPFSLRGLLDSFYRRYDPAICGDGFDETGFRAALGQKILQSVGLDGDLATRLARQDIERVYPLFRGRYWMDANTSRNLRLGRAATPFASAELVALTSGMPYGFKNYGRLQAAIIKHLDPALAAYPSDYGFNFADGPGMAYRLKSMPSLYRPLWLRRMSYKLQHRRWPVPVKPAGLDADLWQGGALEPFFNRDLMRDAAQIKRLASAACLVSRLGLKV